MLGFALWAIAASGWDMVKSIFLVEKMNEGPRSRKFPLKRFQQADEVSHLQERDHPRDEEQRGDDVPERRVVVLHAHGRADDEGDGQRGAEHHQVVLQVIENTRKGLIIKVRI